MEDLRSHSFSDALIGAAADAIVAVDAEGRLVVWNEAAVALFGHSKEEAIGRSLDMIIPEAMRGDHAAGMARIQRGGLPRLLGKSVDVPAVRADGTTIPIEMRIFSWNDGETFFGAVIRETMARQASQERLHSLAHYDQLTMLPNRSHFVDKLDESLTEGASAASLIVADIDRFADINDQFGDAVGDALLESTALCLKRFADSRSGGKATAARVGANQFAVLLPGVRDMFEATGHAEALRRELKSLCVGADRPVTTSVGVAIAPEHGDSAGKLMANADFALRRAKAAGGDRRMLFQPPQRDAARMRRELELALTAAWRNGEFEVHYQPQVRLKDETIVGVEALLRWRRPGSGIVLPGLFLHVLETSPLAEQVGDFVLEEACRRAAGWRELAGRPIRTGVNLFERQFIRHDQPRRIEKALAAANLPADCLELEIIETTMTSSDDETIRRVKRLRDLGVGIAFDDYGTGYASLGLLKRYPITRLKIDRAFVKDLASDNADVAIVELVLTLGRRFGLGVIAEGVETVEQADLLREMGCVEAQGFLFGKPMSAAEISTLLAHAVGDEMVA